MFLSAFTKEMHIRREEEGGVGLFLFLETNCNKSADPHLVKVAVYRTSSTLMGDRCMFHEPIGALRFGV